MKRKHLFERIMLVIREYFKFPLQNINHIPFVVPGKMYYHYGNVIAAYPITAQEKDERQQSLKDYLSKLPLNLEAEQLEGVRHSALCNCFSCPLSENIPCPYNNILKDKKYVCYSHRYEIIKEQ